MSTQTSCLRSWIWCQPDSAHDFAIVILSQDEVSRDGVIAGIQKSTVSRWHLIKSVSNSLIHLGIFWEALLLMKDLESESVCFSQINSRGAALERICLIVQHVNFKVLGRLRLGQNRRPVLGLVRKLQILYYQDGFVIRDFDLGLGAPLTPGSSKRGAACPWCGGERPLFPSTSSSQLPCAACFSSSLLIRTNPHQGRIALTS
jgi:hypothetical protein